MVAACDRSQKLLFAFLVLHSCHVDVAAQAGTRSAGSRGEQNAAASRCLQQPPSRIPSCPGTAVVERGTAEKGPYLVSKVLDDKSFIG